MQPLTRHHHQGERIVRRVAPADPGQPHAPRLDLDARCARPDSSRTRSACRTARPVRSDPGSRQDPDAGARSAATGCPAVSWRSSQSGLAGGSLSRSGSVLMNSPTMLSMPAISGGRPATVTPNTTSSRPVMRPSRMRPGRLHHVLSVTPCRRAAATSAAVCVSSRVTVRSAPAQSRRDGCRRCGATCVASSRPASASCQAATAASRSCAASQDR